MGSHALKNQDLNTFPSGCSKENRKKSKESLNTKEGPPQQTNNAPQLSTMKMRELNEKSAPHLSSSNEESDVWIDGKKTPLKCQQVKVALEREARVACAPQVSTNHLARTRAAMCEQYLQKQDKMSYG